MTITVESYIGKVGGKEGVKLEQQYLISKNGLELMSNHPLEDIL
jgi:Xaa-Pro aminopeptidase